jgi:two-component sensor histidine kinase
MVLVSLEDISERKRAEAELKFHAAFEELIANLSTNFVSLKSDEIDEGINLALEAIGEFAQVDRSYVFRFNSDLTVMDNTHEWCADGIEPQIGNLQGLPSDVIPWWVGKLRKLETIYIPKVDDLPPEANGEKEILQAQDIMSLIVVPMVSGGTLVGFLGFDSVHEEKKWSEDIMTLLKVVGESFANVLERRKSEGRIRKSLAEKEVMLREIHHRVKNNLQVISSLLSLQASYVDDDNLLTIFKDSQNRIRSMALIHEKLYQSEDLARVDFSDYITDLIRTLFSSYRVEPDRIELSIDISDIKLNIGTSIPLALIINELISNSIEHAFADGRNGNITVKLHENNDHEYELVVSDNGIGLPDDFDVAAAEKLGFNLVNILVKQLDGVIDIGRDDGVRFTLKFKTID